MKLQELREMMDTDARRRVEAQEKTIRELHQKVADLDRQLKQANLELERRGRHEK